MKTTYRPITPFMGIQTRGKYKGREVVVEGEYGDGDYLVKVLRDGKVIMARLQPRAIERKSDNETEILPPTST